ncbi:matrix remodeling-associated protein 8 isoform X2 [Rhinatrema bivittatum]|uniref:matrix remodeling-associated protein 8 isoform X2 n=1 Tax=Rhinatrema bivittatum TaxID=194408 RepID=UPI00112D6E27|nr:matrix remodeling-associated protein 8 isoform X2 [Rhinatrema bivittatum]
MLKVLTVPSDESNTDSVVVSVSNITAVVGSQSILQCQSHRMVWTQDSLKDRQRVVHWDLYSSDGSYKAERLVDMYSAGDQRIYSSYNQGRIAMPQMAFFDGNFSLVIKGVADRDQGIYSCNLHHHYCHLYKTEKIQLDVTHSEEEEKMYWDGEKVVIVALAGTTVLLPCENRNHLWTERYLEEDQQVVHWDRQPPGVPHDRADRLIDLYASGERRSYGPLFIRKKMSIDESSFARGDFSLHISELERADEGTYSCHLHHHYCGLHERRIFHLSVTEPLRREKPANRTDLSVAPAGDSNAGKEQKVINVIIPESRMHFIQQLGYILATLLLFLILLAAVVLITRRRRRRGFGYDVKKSEEKEVNVAYGVETMDQKLCKSENIQLDYKNNILKERAGLDKLLPAKNIDLEPEFRKEYCK